MQMFCLPYSDIVIHKQQARLPRDRATLYVFAGDYGRYSYNVLVSVSDR